MGVIDRKTAKRITERGLIYKCRDIARALHKDKQRVDDYSYYMFSSPKERIEIVYKQKDGEDMLYVAVGGERVFKAHEIDGKSKGRKFRVDRYNPGEWENNILELHRRITCGPSEELVKRVTSEYNS